MKKIGVLLFLLLLIYIAIVFSQGIGIFIDIVTIDTTAPNITITKIGPTSARNVTVSGTVFDDSAIANITLEVNSSYIVNAIVDTITWNVTINLSEGWNHFYVLAYDEFGNFANVTSSSQGASILLDTTPPNINLTGISNNSKVANLSIIILDIKDLFLSNNLFHTLNDDVPIPLTIYEIEVRSPPWIDGINFLIINATDSTGNVKLNNYTFTYDNSYGTVLDTSKNAASRIINITNDTLNDLQDSSALQSLVDDLPVDISVKEYNNTLVVLDVVNNLSNAVSLIEILLQEILDADASGNSNATKRATINAILKQITNIRNTTISAVNINLFDPNLTVSVTNITTSNVMDELALAISGLSASDKLDFVEKSEALQDKTTIINKVQTITLTFLNGRTSNITLFEKNITISELQLGEFYINEFIDKNITGDNDLNANTDITNRVSTALTVVKADPIARWSFSDVSGAVVKYTVDNNVPTEKNTESKTVITTVPAILGSDDSEDSGTGTSGGGGGGGGGGASPIKKSDFSVDKNILKTVLRQGESKEETINIKNTGSVTLKLTAYLQDLRQFIFSPSIDEIDITLNPDEDQTLNIIFKAGEDVIPDIYTGEIIIKNGNLEKIVKTIIEVDSAKPLFDVDVEVLPEYKIVSPGDELFIEVSLFNVRGFGRVDVNLEYSIKDFQNNLIAKEDETVAVETQAKFVRELLVPNDIKPDTYIAAVKVTFEDSIGTSSDVFEVKAKAIRLYPISLKNYTFLLIVGSIVLVFSVIAYLILGSSKKTNVPKTEVEQNKAIKNEEKIYKLEKQLAALEQGFNSKFISESSYMKGKERIKIKLEKLKG